MKETISLTVLVDLEYETPAGRELAVASLSRGSGFAQRVRPTEGGAYCFGNFRPLRATIAPVVDGKPPRRRRARKARAEQ